MGKKDFRFVCTHSESTFTLGTLRVLVDRETGLVLGHWLRYTHRGTGAETLYVMRCELFETAVEALPVFFPL